jgi:hypothetical protein
MNPNENMTSLQQEELASQIEELNTQLLDESAASAARAFNLGCVLSGLLVGIVVTVAFLLSHWVTAFITLLLTALIAVGVSAVLSMRARYNNMVHIYQQSIVPIMQDILRKENISLEEWNALITENLSEEASLRLLIEKFPLEG